MAFCTNCGHQLVDGAKFCLECGTPIANMQAAQQSERKTTYDGEIHKCPQCGEVLDSFLVTCPCCGYELRGTKNSSAISEFVKKLEEIEASRDEKKGSASLVKILTTDNISKTDERKVNLIRSFSIPNTKEDVYEFLILAASNIDVKLYGMSYDSSQLQGMIVASQRAVSDAWLAKFEQAYQKAQLLFGGSQEFQNIQSLYEQKMKEIGKKKRQLPVLLVSIIGGSILFCALMVLIALLAGGGQNQNIQDTSKTTVNQTQTSSGDTLTQPTSVNDVDGVPEDVEAPTNATETMQENIENDKNNDNSEVVGPHEVKGSADSSVEVIAYPNKYLDIDEFGWYINNGYLQCVAIIRNNSDKYAIEYATFRITAYSEDDKVLGTEEQVLSIIYPQQDFACPCLVSELNEKPHRIEITLLEPEEYGIRSVETLEHTTYKQMIGQNITVDKDRVTGVIHNPNDYQVDFVLVAVLFRNDEGNIVYGEMTFVDQIPARGTVPFDVSVYSDGILETKYEVLAYPW